MIIKAILFSMLLFLIKGVLGKTRQEFAASVVGFLVLLETIIVLIPNDFDLYILFPFVSCINIVVFIYIMKSQKGASYSSRGRR